MRIRLFLPLLPMRIKETDLVGIQCKTIFKVTDQRSKWYQRLLNNVLVIHDIFVDATCGGKGVQVLAKRSFQYSTGYIVDWIYNIQLINELIILLMRMRLLPLSPSRICLGIPICVINEINNINAFLGNRILTHNILINVICVRYKCSVQTYFCWKGANFNVYGINSELDIYTLWMISTLFRLNKVLRKGLDFNIFIR